MQHVIFEPSSCILLDSGDILIGNDTIKKLVIKPHAVHVNMIRGVFSVIMCWINQNQSICGAKGVNRNHT